MVYLNSDIVSSVFGDSTNQSSGTLAIMYTGSFRNYSYITQQFDITSNAKRFASKNAIFNFSLVDENSTQINLHGIDYSFTLVLFTYSPNLPLYKKLSHFIDVEQEKNKQLYIENET